jgi:hypothetical protein
MEATLSHQTRVAANGNTDLVTGIGPPFDVNARWSVYDSALRHAEFLTWIKLSVFCQPCSERSVTVPTRGILFSGPWAQVSRMDRPIGIDRKYLCLSGPRRRAYVEEFPDI